MASNVTFGIGAPSFAAVKDAVYFDVQGFIIYKQVSDPTGKKWIGQSANRPLDGFTPLDSEAVIRQVWDSYLQTLLATETNSRASGDLVLQNQINELKQDYKNVFLLMGA